LPAGIETHPNVIPGRRDFLLAAASGVAAAPLLALNTDLNAGQTSPIRPPGAQDEERFVAACIRCGQCMKACPQNALHPAGFQAGLAGLWTPRIVPVLGYCDYNCISDEQPAGNFCSTVCPTGAISRLSPQQKHATPLGTAYFRIDRCIPYVERTNCSVCVEHCPVPQKALKNEIIEVRDLQTGEMKRLQRPYVDKTLCIGCGQCENVCPLKGPKGIRVEPLRSPI
jgi:MauM/NapG family ferredoxin protein